jgi:hypothetical protein
MWPLCPAWAQARRLGDFICRKQGKPQLVARRSCPWNGSWLRQKRALRKLDTIQAAPFKFPEAWWCHTTVFIGGTPVMLVTGLLRKTWYCFCGSCVCGTPWWQMSCGPLQKHRVPIAPSWWELDCAMKTFPASSIQNSEKGQPFGQASSTPTLCNWSATQRTWKHAP